MQTRVHPEGHPNPLEPNDVKGSRAETETGEKSWFECPVRTEVL